MRQRPFALAACAFALAAALGGCVVAPAYPRYPAGGGYGGGYDDGVVSAAPPPPRYEVIGVAPHPAWFWIGGYWNWVGNRHVWIGGHWESNRPGYVWSPHRWYRDGPGWRRDPGRWHRR